MQVKNSFCGKTETKKLFAAGATFQKKMLACENFQTPPPPTPSVKTMMVPHTKPGS